MVPDNIKRRKSNGHWYWEAYFEWERYGFDTKKEAKDWLNKMYSEYYEAVE